MAHNVQIINSRWPPNIKNGGRKFKMAAEIEQIEQTQKMQC